MEVLEHDENRSRRCRFEESKPEIVQETEVLDLRCRRVQKLLHPAGMRLVFDIVDPRQKDPNRGHRGCQRDLGLDVQALSPSGRKTKLSGALLHVGDQRRLADPGVPGNQHDLRLSLAGEPEGVVQLAALGLTTNDLNACSSDHGALPRPIVLHRHRAVTPPCIGERPAKRNAEMLLAAAVSCASHRFSVTLRRGQHMGRNPKSPCGSSRRRGATATSRRSDAPFGEGRDGVCCGGVTRVRR